MFKTHHHIIIVTSLALFCFALFTGGFFSNPSKTNAASSYFISIDNSQTTISNFNLSISGAVSASPYVGQTGSQGVYVTSWGDGTPATPESVAKSLTFNGNNFTGVWGPATHHYSSAGPYRVVASVCHQGCTGAEGSSTGTASLDITINPDGGGSATVVSTGGGAGGGAQLTPDKSIITFEYPGATSMISGTNILLTVPFGTDVTKIVPTFTFVGDSVKVGSVVQESGVTQNDFTNPLTYIVTATNQSTLNYTVSVVVAPNPYKLITTFDIGKSAGVINDEAQTIVIYVPYGTNVTSLKPTIVVTPGATISPTAAIAQDFTNPVKYTVTAADGTKIVYTVTVIISPKPAPCKALLTTYIKLGEKNLADDVKRLENFLNTHEGAKLVVDGVYKQADFEAVMNLQKKYDEVLKDWSIMQPTGYVFRSTQRVINRLACEGTR